LKKLYCCGDSFTDKDYWSKTYQKGLTTCWPEIVKKKLGDDWLLYNGAYVGASNNFIVRDFFNYIAVNGDPDCVCIAWTNAGRVSHWESRINTTGFTKDISIDPIGHYNNSVHKINKYKRMIEPAIALGEYIVKQQMWSRYMSKSINDWLTNIFVIQNYCNSNNINHIFIQAISPIEYIVSKHKYKFPVKEVVQTLLDQNLFNHIDNETFVDWPALKSIGGNTIDDLTRETDKSFGLEDSHPNDNGHEMIANKIYEAYYDNYIR